MASGPIKPGFVQDYEEKKQQENADKIKQERLKAKQEKQRQKELKREQPVENTNKNQKTIILGLIA